MGAERALEEQRLFHTLEFRITLCTKSHSPKRFFKDSATNGKTSYSTS